MSQRVTFNGAPLYGTVLDFGTSPPRLQSRLVKYWGLQGEAELRGEGGGREIFCRMIVHEEYGSYAALAADLKRWDVRASQHNNGIFKIENSNNGVTESWKNCTFLGLERLTGPGMGPLYDVAGTLDGGWLWHVVIRVYQLVVD